MFFTPKCVFLKLGEPGEPETMGVFIGPKNTTISTKKVL
jgi:hypothetical protein